MSIKGQHSQIPSLTHISSFFQVWLDAERPLAESDQLHSLLAAAGLLLSIEKIYWLLLLLHQTQCSALVTSAAILLLTCTIIAIHPHHTIIPLCPLSKVASMRIFSVFSMLQLVFLYVMHFSTGGAIPSYWMQLSAISPNCSITTFFSAHTATGHEQLQMENHRRA